MSDEDVGINGVNKAQMNPFYLTLCHCKKIKSFRNLPFDCQVFKKGPNTLDISFTLKNPFV